MTPSLYEKMFRTRARGKGRPPGGDVIFPIREKEHKDLAQLARQRAFAIVLEENKDRLSELFESEYKVLERQRRREAN
jgi:hypothetical protein